MLNQSSTRVLTSFYGRQNATLGPRVQRLTRMLDADLCASIFNSSNAPNLDFAVALLALISRVSDSDEQTIDLLLQPEPVSGPQVKSAVSLSLATQAGDSFDDVYQAVAKQLDRPAPDQSQSAAEPQLMSDLRLLVSPMTDAVEFSGLSQTIPLEDEESATALSVKVYLAGDSIALCLDFNEQAWPEAAERERALQHYVLMLEALAADSSQSIDRVDLLTRAERDLLFPGAADAGIEADALPTVIESFATQVAARPDHPAVVMGDQQLTYRELEIQVRQLSKLLRSKGVVRGSLVGICMSRSIDMLTALLAVMNCGGAYIPIDPLHPQSRISKILEDVDPVMLLAETETSEKLGEAYAERIYCLDQGDWLGQAEDSLSSLASAGDDAGELAYIIFTSGSTGRPKGVEVFHHGLSAFLAAMSERPGMNETDRLLAITTVSFDIAGLELYLPLVVGATLYIATSNDVLDGRAMQALLVENEITLLQATPATYHILIANGWQGDNSSLKLLCGGEALPPELALKLLPCCAELWNMYGPTETTIWSTCQKIEAVSATVSIGSAIKGTQTYVLNEAKQPVPLGVPGELYIAGQGVARGYHGRDDLSAERFLPDPFSSEPDSRMYRSGDLVRCTDDGNIECLGRLDNQVKIRGYRIELGEIETAISDLEAVHQNVVGVYQTANGINALAMYIVLEEGCGSLEIDSIHEHLKPLLPSYMIPNALIFLDALPLTPNNKIDRKALPAPTQGRGSAAGETELPTDPIERKIIQSWQGMLGLSGIDTSDNFVELGGDSLTFIQASMVLEDILGQVPDNWETMTIAELSKVENSGSIFKNVDSVVLIRAIAITFVVVTHFGLSAVHGATNALFMTSGYLFATYQLNTTCSKGSVSPILASIIMISIPTILYTAFMQVWVQEFHIENLLLYGNYLDPDFDGGVGGYWFLQVLVQMLLILMIMLSFKSVRRLASANPFSFSVGLLLLSAGLHFAGPYVWDTNDIFNRVPHMKFWLFMFGWCAFLSDSHVKKALVGIIMVAVASPALSYDPTTFYFTIASGFLMLVFPVVKLAFPINRIVHLLGGASLFIYLTHFQFSGVYNRLGFDSHVIFNVIAALIGGVIVWRAWDFFIDKLKLSKLIRELTH